VTIESVEDILQDVFMKVFVNLNAYDNSLEFSSWIYRIAHNETINYWRKHKKRKDLVVSLDANEALKNVIGDKQDVEKEVFGKIHGEQVMAALGNLDEKYREVLTENYVNGKSYREIAENLDSPIGTVGTLLNRGKKLLREKLEGEGFSKEAFAG
jgi:RNA polymerase sigma-70 factor (ECF subfamily)